MGIQEYNKAAIAGNTHNITSCYIQQDGTMLKEQTKSHTNERHSKQNMS